MKFHPDIIRFLSDLKENNDREWFNANKNNYLKVKAEFENTVAKIITEVGAFDDDIKYLTPAECTFRIYRDTRFAKDGEPYKTNMGAYMAKNGRKSIYAGYYLHIEPGKSFAGGGIYMPLPENLLKIRQEICNFSSDFETIIRTPEFKKVYGELETIDALKKMPKGFPADAPDIIRHKHFIASYSIPDTLFSQDNFTENIVNIFKTLQPLNAFFNRALE